MRAVLVLAVLIGLAGCGDSGLGTAGNSREAAARSWWRWHADKQEVDRAISEAIGESGSGDYAKAIGILQRSDRPDEIKLYQTGTFIVGSFDYPGARRPAITLAQALRMVEQATAGTGEPAEVGPQYLRMVFERGAGRAPNAIPIDPVVAACWHRIETTNTGDPKRCIALRRQRLPQLND